MMDLPINSVDAKNIQTENIVSHQIANKIVNKKGVNTLEKYCNMNFIHILFSKAKRNVAKNVLVYNFYTSRL